MVFWGAGVAFCYDLLVWWPSGMVSWGAEGHNRRPPHQKAITEDHFQPEGHLQSEGHQTRRP